MTDFLRRRRTAVIESIEVEVSGDDGHSWKAPEEEGLDPTEVYEVSKVVTHVQFYKNGEAGLWVDLTISNDCPNRDVRINYIDIRLRNSRKEIDLERASAGEGYQREIPDDVEIKNEKYLDYLWNEIIDRSELDQSELELENSWTTMYDFYDEENCPDVIHDMKDACQYDRIFFHESGSKQNRQHLVCDPVGFTKTEIEEDMWRLRDLKTIVSYADNHLLSKEKINEDCWGEKHHPTKCDEVEHRNAATLWVLWDNVDVMRDHTEIDFNFEFGIRSKIGEIRNLYMYYILPEGGAFMESNSSVGVFQPLRNHWMFGAWYRFGKTGIDRTGPENRILRSKNEDVDFDADLGEYRLRRRWMANELLQSIIFTLIPALFGAFASALVTAFIFEQDAAIPYPIPYILLGMIAVITTLQVYGIYVTIFGKYTWASAGILMIADYIDEAVSIVKDRTRAVYGALRDGSS